MTRAFRRGGRYAAYTLGATTVGVAAIVLPSKESLPSALLPSRVLLEGIGRVGRCAYVSSQIYFDYAYNLRGVEDQVAWDAVHERSAHRLVALAESNGGLYVKAGQIFSNMTHILPYQFCRVMAVLQDAVVKRPYREIVAVLESELGKPLDEVFSFVEPQPIAAASLAQVHRGTLRKEGTDVAIKVQYIDIAQRFHGDMRTIDLMLRTAGALFPGFDFGPIVMKLNDTVEVELDFRLEGQNSDRAALELRRGGFGDRVVCAEVMWNYVTKRVLVTRFVDGARISDRKEMEARGIDWRQAAAAFIDAFSFQVFHSGFFHGDPHAGNVLVHKLPNGKPQVVLLDYGLCAELDPMQRREVSDIWTSSVTHDNYTLKQIAGKYGCEDYELFASCFLQHPYVFYSVQKGRLMDKKVQENMRDTVKHKMTEVNYIIASLPKAYALVLRGIMATKAINHELGDAVNRPVRMVRYSLRTSREKTYHFVVLWMLCKAWFAEWYAYLMMELAKWKHPELADLMESSLQITG